MNNKGFTLLELLAVIVILAIILAIAVPTISSLIENSRLNAYQSSEKMLASAARNYLASRSEFLPTEIGFIKIIDLNDLVINNYINQIRDSKNSADNCDGYVVVRKTDSTNHEFKPYMKCGSNYITTDYVDVPLASLEVLVVAGGGAGGSHKITGTSTGAGGGGAGGVIYNSSYDVTSLTSVPVTVGEGGISPITEGAGNNGGNSVFGSLTAIGGGGGGGRWFFPQNGGSGGGVGYYSATGGLGTSVQGNAGGSGDANIYGGSGGGGASTAGIYRTTSNGTAGGSGIYYGNIFGDNYGINGYFAGGGGGGSGSGAYVGGIGGIGGGGIGGSNSNGTHGAVNSGSGGGGASSGGYLGGNGGSGIVLVKYVGPQKANGGIVTTKDGYTIHSFTNTGVSSLELLTF